MDAAQDLPATLEFRESGEDAFFAVVVSEVNGSAVNFKLAPTFTLYMCCRYRLSPKFRPDFPPNKRREKVMLTANKVANMMWQTVKVSFLSGTNFVTSGNIVVQILDNCILYMGGVCIMFTKNI